MEGEGGKDPVFVSYKQGSYMFYSMRHSELLWQLESVQMGWLCLMKWGPLQSIHEANSRINEFRYLVIKFFFCFFFRDTISPCNFGWLGTCCVDRLNSQKNPLASTYLLSSVTKGMHHHSWVHCSFERLMFQIFFSVAEINSIQRNNLGM